MHSLLKICGSALLFLSVHGSADTPGRVQGIDKAGTPKTSPLPLCTANDSRTKVPVWQPAMDDEGNLSSDPPQNDGLIVYVRFFQDASAVTCDNAEMNVFNRPTNPEDFVEGGLAVNIRGNTQLSNGICYFSGFYLNEDVMGMHQGWTETYYGAVEKKEVVLSGKFCMETGVD